MSQTLKITPPFERGVEQSAPEYQQLLSDMMAQFDIKIDYSRELLDVICDKTVESIEQAASRTVSGNDRPYTILHMKAGDPLEFWGTAENVARKFKLSNELLPHSERFTPSDHDSI